MRVYLSGPMSGIEDDNRPAFNIAAERMRDAGHEVVNPAELPPLPREPEPIWESYMRRDIPLLCGCEAVAVMRGWHASRGAVLEALTGRLLGLPVYIVESMYRGETPAQLPARTGFMLERMFALHDPDAWRGVIEQEAIRMVRAGRVNLDGAELHRG